MRFHPILAVLSPFVGAACASPGPEAPPPRSGVQESVERLAVTLIDLAERRVDLSTVRAAVLPFHGEVAGRPTGPTPVGTQPTSASSTAGADATTAADRDLPALELEREFELALANRLNLVEMSSEEIEARFTAVGPPPPDATHVASHALLGDYTARDGKLILSVRLVDLESRLVLSAARDTIPISWLSSGARTQLERATPTKRATAIAIAAESLAAHTDVASAPRATQVVSPSAVTPAANPAATPAAPQDVTSVPPARPTPTTGPVEDFETWRARRSSEPMTEIPPRESAAPGPPSGSPSQSPPAPKAMQGVASFPWRHDGRLSALLRIPKPR